MLINNLKKILRININHFVLIPLFVFVLVQNSVLQAQTFTMSNGGSTSSCTGTFLDPGGAGNYAGGSSDWTYTICNPTAGQPIYLSFSMFDLWSNSCIWGASVDELFIYNGPNTASPLIGTYSDNTSAPTNISGTSGCITVRFHRENLGGLGCSSNSGNPGWSAAISCTPPPPDGSGCFQSIPFCTAMTYNFPNSTGTSAPGGPNYGCLGSQPNPTWYYMEVDQGGTFNIGLVQTTGPNGTGSGIDVDFALYGPFTSLNAGCTSVMGGGLAPIQCSFSTAFTETIGIGLPGGTGSGASTPPAAVAGQFYIVLLTNFNGSAGYMDFNQNGGSGIADCSIVTPCDITALTATPGACVPANNQYNLTGQVTFVNAPATGTLTVTNSCGGSQTFNAPFTSPTNYSIPSLTSNGAACIVTAAFSSDATCSLTQNYTAPASCTAPPPCNMNSLNYTIGACEPGSLFTITGTFTFSNAPAGGTVVVTATNSVGSQTQTFNAPFTNGLTYNFSIPNNAANGSPLTVTVQFSSNPACSISLASTSTASCNCSADIGTFTITTAGDGINNYVLCYDDEITVTANGDYTAPDVANAPANPTGYSPSVGYLVYSCPPTIGLIPNAINGPEDDPCLIGIYDITNMYDFNDQYWMNAYPGVFANNIVYFVPITFYQTTTAPYLYSYTNTSLPCYEIGAPIAVQYLPEITFTQTQACQLGTATATITGGYPAINGSQFTVVPGSLSPATATFNNTTAANGGTITIGGLVNGDNFSYQVQDNNGCPITIIGTFTGVTASGFTYPETNYCQNDANPVPTITGVAGGTFSYTPLGGLSINAGTGVINLAASLPGAYTITYSSPGFPCNSQTTFDIIIDLVPVVNVPSMPICAGGSTTLTASGANSYTWSPATGLSATTGTSVTANPLATQVYTIVGTNSTGCQGTTTATVTVNPGPTIGGTFSACSGNTSQLVGPGTPNAVTPWQSSNPAVATVNATGLVAGVSSGTATITYTNSNGCQGTQLFTVHALPVVSANDESLCLSETAVLTATGADTYTWAPALNLSSTTGTSVTFTPGITTNYTVTGTDVNGCVSSDALTVTVFANPPVAASADVAICNGESTIISANGAISYTWNQGLGIGSSHTVSPTVTTMYSVIGTDGNGCTNTDNVTVTVNQLPIVFAGQDQTICIGEGVTLTGQGAVSYVWTAPVVNGVEFFPNATASYNVEGTDVNGCKNDDDVIVVVNPLPIVNAGNDLAGCNGDNFVLTGSGAGASGTYDWDTGVMNGVPFTPPTGTTIYTVVGTDANGCENTDQLTIFIQDPPAVSFTYVQDGFCIPATVTFTNTTVPMGVNCIWNFDDGTVINGCGPVITHTFTSAGQFGASLQTETAANGCVASVYYPNIIFVEANPVANFSADPTTTTTIATEVQFTNESTGATSYVWDFGDDSPTSTLVNPSHQFTENEPGNYNVMLIARSPLGCADTAYRIIRISEELIFYVPNTFTPDGDSYNETFTPIFTSGFDPYDYNLQIYNRWGEIIFESNDASIGWAGNYGVDGNRCQDGVYNWKIEFKTTATDERKIINGHVNLMR